MNDNSSYHIPVLLQQSVEGLAIKPNGTYVDVTFGGGGHSREILKHLGNEGRLFAFDQDTDAAANAIADDRIWGYPIILPHFRRRISGTERQQVCG